MIQDSSITSTDAPEKIPHLQITKFFHSDEEYIECKKAIESSSLFPCISHFCDVTSTLKSALASWDSVCDAKGRVSVSKVKSLISAHVDRGYYFVLMDIKPTIINCRNKVITLRYPLFMWKTMPCASTKNIHMDSGFYMKWFTMYQPHASRLFGLGVSQSIGYVFNEVSALNSFHKLNNEVLRSTLRDVSSQELIGSYEFSVIYLPPGASEIPVLYQLEMPEYGCNGNLCHTPTKDLCMSDEWECSYKV